MAPCHKIWAKDKESLIEMFKKWRKENENKKIEWKTIYEPSSVEKRWILLIKFKK